jgi:hypothetical protein
MTRSGSQRPQEAPEPRQRTTRLSPRAGAMSPSDADRTPASRPHLDEVPMDRRRAADGRNG